MLELYQDEMGRLTLDDRWFPVVIGTWWGQIGHRTMDTYFGWYDRQLARAHSEGTKIALVIDALGVKGLNGEMRRRFVSESDAREAMNREHVTSMHVVLRSALLRAMLASVATLVRSALRVSSSPDLASALERALAKLDGAGVARPAGLDPRSYAAPSRTQEP